MKEIDSIGNINIQYEIFFCRMRMIASGNIEDIPNIPIHNLLCQRIFLARELLNNRENKEIIQTIINIENEICLYFSLPVNSLILPTHLGK